MRVLAIDPGAKTGIALFDADAQKVDYFAIVPNGLEGVKDWWFTNCHNTEGCTIVAESFELDEGVHGIDYESPLSIIHWLKEQGIVDVWQRRNQRGKDKVASVAVLKRAGLYPPRGQVKEGHQIAALQHALSFLIKIRHHPTIALLHPKES